MIQPWDYSDVDEDTVVVGAPSAHDDEPAPRPLERVTESTRRRPGPSAAYLLRIGEAARAARGQR